MVIVLLKCSCMLPWHTRNIKTTSPVEYSDVGIIQDTTTPCIVIKVLLLVRLSDATHAEAAYSYHASARMISDHQLVLMYRAYTSIE